MKDVLLLGLLAAAGIGGAVIYANNNASQGKARKEAQAAGALPGLPGFAAPYLDPFTGLPLDPLTGLPNVPNVGLSPEAEAALLRQSQDASDQWLRDQKDAADRIASDNAATQAQLRFTDGLTTAAVVGTSALWAAGKVPALARGVASGAGAAARGATALGRAATGALRAPLGPAASAGVLLGGAVRGAQAIAQGAADLEARARGEGPYAKLNEPAAITAATANVAAGTAVGAGSLGLAELDFNRGVYVLGLPVTEKVRGNHVRFFGQSWLEW